MKIIYNYLVKVVGIDQHADHHYVTNLEVMMTINL